MAEEMIEKFQQGQYAYRLVEEIPPLGEDRSAVYIPAPQLEQLKSQIEDVVSATRGEMFSMAAMIMGVLGAKYGDEAYEAVEQVMYDYGRGRAEEFGRIMKIDPKDARSVGRVFDLEDSQHDIKGEWVETGRKRAVKREYFCPMAEGAALCPEMCTRVAAAVEQGTLDGLGVKGRFFFTKLLPKGDPYCEVVIELED